MEYDLSVVIPTYKEANNIQLLVPDIENVIRKEGLRGEIVIVDDYSGDGIESVIAELCKTFHNINLIVRNGVRGLASAWHDGMEASRGKKIAIMDADLAHDACYLPQMFHALKNSDMVIGSRYIKGHQVLMKDKSFLALCASLVGQVVIRIILGIQPTDISHSFRMFKREVFEELRNDLHCDGNMMMVEFTYKAIINSFRVSEIPVIYGERKFGETKLNLSKETINFFKGLIYLRRSYRPNMNREK